MLVSIQIYIITITILVLFLKQTFAQCPIDSGWIYNGTNYNEKYPKLVELFEQRTKFENSEKGTRSIEFINWQDTVLRLVCPGTKTGEEVLRWNHRYFSTPENDDTKEKENDFGKKDYNSWQLIVPTHIKFEYFSVYSCQNLAKCWHHFYVVTRPSPRTTFPIYYFTGSDGIFSCWNRNRTDKEPKFSINMPPLSMHWETNSTGNIAFDSIYGVINGVNTTIEERVFIKDTSELHAGKYECVIIDQFNISSHPDKFDGYHLISGKRFSGFAHVHIRPVYSFVYPIGIIIALLCALPLMIKFCPYSANEADLEEDDDDMVKIYREKSEDSVLHENVGMKNGIQEDEKAPTVQVLSYNASTIPQ